MHQNTVRDNASNIAGADLDLFENIPIGVFHLSADFQLKKVNPAMALILGHSDPEEMLKTGARFLPYFSSTDDGKNFRQDVLSRKDIVEGEYPLLRCDGRCVWCRLSIRRVPGQSGGVFYYQGTLQDISERKRLEHMSSVLYEISNAVSTTLDLDHLYRTIHQILKRVVDATNFFIAMIDEKNDRLLFHIFRTKVTTSGPSRTSAI